MTMSTSFVPGPGGGRAQISTRPPGGRVQQQQRGQRMSPPRLSKYMSLSPERRDLAGGCPPAAGQGVTTVAAAEHIPRNMVRT